MTQESGAYDRKQLSATKVIGQRNAVIHTRDGVRPKGGHKQRVAGLQHTFDGSAWVVVWVECEIGREKVNEATGAVAQVWQFVGWKQNKPVLHHSSVCESLWCCVRKERGREREKELLLSASNLREPCVREQRVDV
jgi:hypothetical protein